MATEISLFKLEPVNGPASFGPTERYEVRFPGSPQDLNCLITAVETTISLKPEGEVGSWVEIQFENRKLGDVASRHFLRFVGQIKWVRELFGWRATLKDSDLAGITDAELISAIYLLCRLVTKYDRVSVDVSGYIVDSVCGPKSRSGATVTPLEIVR